MTIELLGVDNHPEPPAAGQAANPNGEPSFGSVVEGLLAEDPALAGGESLQPSETPDEDAAAAGAMALLAALFPVSISPPAAPIAPAEVSGPVVSETPPIEPDSVEADSAAPGALDAAPVFAVTSEAPVSGSRATVEHRPGLDTLVVNAPGRSPDAVVALPRAEPAAARPADPVTDAVAEPVADAAPPVQAAVSPVGADEPVETRPAGTSTTDDAGQSPIARRADQMARQQAERSPAAPSSTPDAPVKKPVVAASEQPGAAPAGAQATTLDPSKNGGRSFDPPFEGSPESSSGASPAASSEAVHAFSIADRVAEPVPIHEPAAGTQSAPPQSLASAAPLPTGDANTLFSAPAAVRAFAPPAADDDVVVPQLVRAMHLQMVRGVGEARLQLEPHHLGAVSVTLKVQNGVVSAVVTAEQAGVRHWIEAHETSLRQALAEQGLFLDSLHVARDGQSPFDRSTRDQEEDAPRRRAPRRDTATFELVA